MGRPAKALSVSAEDRAPLESMARSQSLQAALSRRAQMILRMADGETYSSIARRYRYSRPTVSFWRTRYHERGIAGLHNELKPGRPRSVSDEQVAQLINTALQSKPKGRTHWTRRSLAAHLDVHLICDNDATHKHARVKAWLARPPRFHLHFTPTYRSWLDQVERWFALITNQAIRRDSIDSVMDVKRRIDEFVVH